MVFEFDSDGFLTERSGELETGIRARYGHLFGGARRINHDCHELLFAADIRNRDPQAMIVATLFTRALEHYQATIILLGRGVIAAARVTLRALVETIFKTRAISMDDETLKVFIMEDRIARLKLMNKAKNNRYPNLEETHAAITEALIIELKQITEGTKPLKTEEWSKRAKMHDWYVTNYALLSKAVHTEVRELDSYLKLGESGEVQQLQYAPSINEIPLLILTAAHCTLIGASAFDKTFEVDFGEKGGAHTKFVEAGFRMLDEEGDSGE